MKINIELDEKYADTIITIQTNEWTKELDEFMAIIKQQEPQRLFGVREDQTILLEPESIDYVFAENRKVYAKIEEESIEVKRKLYEIEELLLPRNFMRFSKSVIGNIRKIERFELSFNGNLCVYFRSGNKEYITRKYVSPIKQKLMMGGEEDENGNK